MICIWLLIYIYIIYRRYPNFPLSPQHFPGHHGFMLFTPASTFPHPHGLTLQLNIHTSVLSGYDVINYGKLYTSHKRPMSKHRMYKSHRKYMDCVSLRAVFWNQKKGGGAVWFSSQDIKKCPVNPLLLATDFTGPHGLHLLPSIFLIGSLGSS